MEWQAEFVGQVITLRQGHIRRIELPDSHHVPWVGARNADLQYRACNALRTDVRGQLLGRYITRELPGLQRIA